MSSTDATFDRTGPDGKLHEAEKVHEMSLVNLHEEFATIASTASLAENLQALRFYNLRTAFTGDDRGPREADEQAALQGAGDVLYLDL